MTKTRQRQYKQESQPEFVTDEEQRLLEIKRHAAGGQVRRQAALFRPGTRSDPPGGSLRQGSTTSPGATPTQSKRCSGSSMPPTRLRRQGAISAAEPPVLPLADRA
jgi:hypothetical protein